MVSALKKLTFYLEGKQKSNYSTAVSPMRGEERGDPAMWDLMKACQRGMSRLRTEGLEGIAHMMKDGVLIEATVCLKIQAGDRPELVCGAAGVEPRRREESRWELRTCEARGGLQGVSS